MTRAKILTQPFSRRIYLLVFFYPPLNLPYSSLLYRLPLTLRPSLSLSKRPSSVHPSNSANLLASSSFFSFSKCAKWKILA